MQCEPLVIAVRLLLAFVLTAAIGYRTIFFKTLDNRTMAVDADTSRVPLQPAGPTSIRAPAEPNTSGELLDIVVRIHRDLRASAAHMIDLQSLAVAGFR